MNSTSLNCIVEKVPSFVVDAKPRPESLSFGTQCSTPSVELSPDSLKGSPQFFESKFNDIYGMLNYQQYPELNNMVSHNSQLALVVSNKLDTSSAWT